MMGSAFVPGHVTGFFEVVEDADPLKAGSRGVGIVLDKGVYTTVKAHEGEGVSVTVNSKPCECPVTMSAIDGVLAIARKNYRIEVMHKLEVPMRQGFGASGAGAFGAALAANKALGLGLSMDQCGEIAHQAEVTNMTGRGDVIAQATGGIVVRTKAGAPGIGFGESMTSKKHLLVFTIGGGLETKSILLDKVKKEKINSAGRRCLEEFLEAPCVENFLLISRKFTRETGLADEKIISAIDKLEDMDVTAAMSMLGNCVFTLTDEPEKVCKYLDYLYIIADIDYTGARVLA